MSTTTEQERREHEEMERKNPHYNLSFESHRRYQRHIRKWKPLIESNDPSIYSDWQKFEYGYWKSENDPFYSMLNSLVDNPLLDRSGFPILYLDGKRYRFLDYSRIDLNKKSIRLRLIRFLFDSYVYMIEHQPGSHVRGIRLHKYSIVSKNAIVRRIDDITELGYNPFDMMYYTTTDSYRTGDKYSRLVGIIIMIVVFIVGYYLFLS